MNDNIAIIHQNPICCLITFHLFAIISCSSKYFVYIVSHCLYLISVASAGDNKIIRQSGDFLDIDNFDIYCLFIFQSFTGHFSHIL